MNGSAADKGGAGLSTLVHLMSSEEHVGQGVDGSDPRTSQTPRTAFRQKEREHIVSKATGEGMRMSLGGTDGP